MHWYLWVGIGTVVGLSARYVMAGNAYGVFVDTLLGVVGAFLASWIVRLPHVESRISWAGKTSFMIWCAASLPLLARVVVHKRAARSVRPATPRQHNSAPAFLLQSADRFAYIEQPTPATDANPRPPQPI